MLELSSQQKDIGSDNQSNYYFQILSIKLYHLGWKMSDLQRNTKKVSLSNNKLSFKSFLSFSQIKHKKVQAYIFSSLIHRLQKWLCFPQQQSNYKMKVNLGLLLFLAIVACAGLDPQLPKHVIRVYGNASLGYYYVNLYIGTPPQEQSVIVDTGSGQLALPCSKCESCGRSHIHRPFDLLRSSSSKIVTCNSGNELCSERCRSSSTDACTFIISYAEGSSLSGILIQDAIQFEPDTSGEAITTTFGCTVKETNLFYTQAANGIFGLAPQRKARLLDMLYEKHTRFTGEEFLFSLCLAKNGGQFAIGRVDNEITQGIQPVKTFFNGDRNLYSLNRVGNIRMKNTILRADSTLGSYGLFIDSGSTFTYFRPKEYNMMLQEIENACALRQNQCKIAKQNGLKCVKIDVAYGKTLQQTLLEMFPSIDIEIDGKIVSWLPDRYFLLRNRHTGEVCLGIQTLDRFLLGANWMVDRNIVFNLRDRTVEIYSGVDCSKQTGRDDLPIYMDTNESLSYFAAVLKIDEAVLTKVILFIFLGIVFIGLLLFLGVRYFKREPVATKKNEAGQDQQSKMAGLASASSQRGLEDHSCEHVELESEGQAAIPERTQHIPTDLQTVD